MHIKQIKKIIHRLDKIEYPSNRELVSLKISIDKHFWTLLNDDSFYPKEIVEELKPEDSVQMLMHKMEFWKAKMPETKIGYDTKLKAIVKEVRT